MDNNDRLAFVRNILANPADDTPRLVYADWLDECGKPMLAEFIRKQIDPDTNRVCMVPLSCIDPVVERVLDKQPHECRREAGNRNCAVHGDGGTVVYTRGFVAEVRLTLAAFIGGPCPERFRGLNGEYCHCHGNGRTTGRAAELFREHPIETVEITDVALREIWCSATDMTWYIADQPLPKLVGLVMHGSRDAARKCYSDALVAHARALAFPVAEAEARFG